MQIAGGRGGGAVTKCLPNGRMRLACPARLAGRCTIKSGTKRGPKTAARPENKACPAIKSGAKNGAESGQGGRPEKRNADACGCFAAIQSASRPPLWQTRPESNARPLSRLAQKPCFRFSFDSTMRFHSKGLRPICLLFRSRFHGAQARIAPGRLPAPQPPIRRFAPARPPQALCYLPFPLLGLFCGFCGFLLSFCCAFAAFPFVFAFRSMNPGFFTT